MPLVIQVQIQFITDPIKKNVELHTVVEAFFSLPSDSLFENFGSTLNIETV